VSEIEVDGTTLYYEDTGSGRTLLFLHGWGTSGRAWDAQRAAFAADHRVVTLDWRGCGRSGRPPDGHTIGGVVDDLVALVPRLGPDRPVVVGSSIGAAFATELALTHPDLVGGVVAVDGPAFWPSLGMDVTDLRARLAADRAGFLAEWVPRWFAPGAPPDLASAAIAEIRRAGVEIDGQFTAFATYDPRPALPRLAVPIHYVHGALDTEIPVAVAHECAARTPGARVSVIDGAGHMPHQERPDAFNAALRAALAAFPLPVA
jgi:pimeloyl-ACP methyl ester carboxylesterase